MGTHSHSLASQLMYRVRRWQCALRSASEAFCNSSCNRRMLAWSACMCIDTTSVGPSDDNDDDEGEGTDEGAAARSSRTM